MSRIRFLNGSWTSRGGSVERRRVESPPVERHAGQQLFYGHAPRDVVVADRQSHGPLVVWRVRVVERRVGAGNGHPVPVEVIGHDPDPIEIVLRRGKVDPLSVPVARRARHGECEPGLDAVERLPDRMDHLGMICAVGCVCRELPIDVRPVIAIGDAELCEIARERMPIRRIGGQGGEVVRVGFVPSPHRDHDLYAVGMGGGDKLRIKEAAGNIQAAVRLRADERMGDMRKILPGDNCMGKGRPAWIVPQDHLIGAEHSDVEKEQQRNTKPFHGH